MDAWDATGCGRSTGQRMRRGAESAHGVCSTACPPHGIALRWPTQEEGEYCRPAGAEPGGGGGGGAPSSGDRRSAAGRSILWALLAGCSIALHCF